MSFIKSEGGWENSESSKQLEPGVHPSLQPRAPKPTPPPQQPYYQHPPVQYVYLPQQSVPPVNVSQTVVMQSPAPPRSFGCLLLCLFLFFPLWPVTIPVAILIWLFSSPSPSHSIGPTGSYQTTSDRGIGKIFLVLAGAAGLILLWVWAVQTLRTNNHLPAVSRIAAVAPASTPSISQAFQRNFDKSFLKSCLAHFKQETQSGDIGLAESYCTCALTAYKQTGSLQQSKDACLEDLNEPIRTDETQPQTVLMSTGYGKRLEGCDAFTDREVVVIAGEHSSYRVGGPAWELRSVSDKEIDDYGWDDQQISDATSSWLRANIVPGSQFLISGNICGSGGFKTITKIQTIDR